MASNEPSNILLDDATLVFKNFAGREGKYNREGDRSCSVLLDDDMAAELEREGWNVKQLKVREEGDTPQKYLTFSVRYPSNGNRVRPPTIVIVTSAGRNSIPEEMCEFVDQADIARVDLIIRPYVWNVNGNTGVKAYLKSMYVFLAEDELALRYAHIPEIGAAPEQPALPAGQGEVIDGEAWEVDDNQLALER